jgi:putative molybdopterin biosynthesis protein
MRSGHPFGGSGGRQYLHDVPLEEALRRWDDALGAAGWRAPLGAEHVAIEDALGRVTAEPIWAQRSSPPFDAAAMDGVAVRATDTVGASESAPLRLRLDDEAVPVDTGDPMPEGFDAVVMLEHLQRYGDTVEILAAVPPNQHVRSIGEDVTATELLLPEGHRLRPADLGAVAAAGVMRVSVRRRPTVVVVPTGDELVPVGVEPGPGQLPDTNSLMLAAQVREAGGDVQRLGIVPDDPETLAEIMRAEARRCDLLVVNAGSSAGADDHTAGVLERVGVLAAHGVAVRPGHPVVLGEIDGTPVIGVPGYPVSAALTIEIFVLPLLARLEGAPLALRPRARARLARKVASAMGEDEYVRVRLGRVRGGLVAAPLSRGAGVLTSLVRADGLVIVPAGTEGVHAGEDVEVSLLRGLEEIERTIVAVGSHDLVLDLAQTHLRRRDPRLSLASSNVGSLGGLLAVRDGLCHVAGSHLLDPATGEYTLPDLDRVVGDRPAYVVRLAHRQQGLLVAPGNPLGLRSLSDAVEQGARYVNRQRGSGTRVLFDHELSRLGSNASDVVGYEREEFTHLAVAAAVASGRADCGLGILAAARALGLDFVPVTVEPYDLVIGEMLPLLEPLLELLEDDSFRSDVDVLGGYDTAEMGRRIR